MVTDEVIQERLRLLAEYIEDLRAEQGISFAQYQDDKKTRRYVEHTIQIAIEACLDIGHHIIAEKHLPLPKEHRDIFQVLGEAEIVPGEAVPALPKMVGFRNRLVHEYERVENELVYGILKKNLGDLERFGQAIRRYLDKEAQAAAEKEQSPPPVQEETIPNVDGEKGKTVRERRTKYTVRRKRKTVR